MSQINDLGSQLKKLEKESQPNLRQAEEEHTPRAKTLLDMEHSHSTT